MFIIAQIFRIFSAIFMIIADKSSDTKKIYLYNGISNFLSSIQYELLGAFSGAVSSMAAILRNIIFYKSGDKKPFIALIIYLIFMCLLAIPTYDGIISLLPTIMVVVYTIAIYGKDVLKIKYAIIIAMTLEVIYDIHYHAYAGIIVCIIDIVLVTISLIKLKKSFKNKQIGV